MKNSTSQEELIYNSKLPTGKGTKLVVVYILMRKVLSARGEVGKICGTSAGSFKMAAEERDARFFLFREESVATKQCRGTNFSLSWTVLRFPSIFTLFHPTFETYYLKPKNSGQIHFWESPSSRSPLSKEVFVQKYGTRPSVRVVQILINATATHRGHRIGQGKGVFDKNLLLWTLQLQERIASTEIVYPPISTSPLTPLSNANPSASAPNKYSLSDFCFKPFSDKNCLVHSPLEFWSNNHEKLASDSAIINTLAKEKPKSSFNIPIPVYSVFGKPEYSQKTGRIIGAESIILTYFLEDMSNWPEGMTVEIWELLWQKVMQNQDMGHIGGSQVEAVNIVNHGELEHLLYYFNNSQYGITAEYSLLALVSLCWFLYISFSIGRLNVVKSKFGLGFSAVAQMIASLISSVSICSLFGVTFTLEILPFIPMIISAENCIILTNAVTSTTMELEVKERVAIGLSNVGLSITNYLGLEILSVIIDYILQMTFFITTLSIDLRRLEISDLYNRRPLVTNHSNKKLSTGLSTTNGKPGVLPKPITFTARRIFSFLAILIVMGVLSNFYPAAVDIKITTSIMASFNPRKAVIAEQLVNNTFWMAETASTADPFWETVNPSKEPRYFEIRPAKLVTIIREKEKDEFESRDTVSGQFDLQPHNKFEKWKRYVIISIKSTAWFIKFVAAPAVGIALGISFLLHFLLSPDRYNRKGRDSRAPIIKLPKKSSNSLASFSPRVITLRGRHSADIDLLCANSKGLVISTATDKHITSWDGRLGTPLRKLERYMRRCSTCKCGTTGGMKNCISWPVRALCASEKVELAAAGFEDGVVRVWDINSGQASHILKDTVDDVESVISVMTGHSPKERVTCLQFVARSNSSVNKKEGFLEDSRSAMLIAAYRNGYIREWDLKSGQISNTIATNQKSGISVLCVLDNESTDNSRNDLRMYSGARDGTVRCWVRRIIEGEKECIIKDKDSAEARKSSWKAVYTLVGRDGNAITCIAAKVVEIKKNPYGIVVTGAADGEVRVYDYVTGGHLMTLSPGALWKQKREKERIQENLILKNEKLLRKQLRLRQAYLKSSILETPSDSDEDLYDEDFEEYEETSHNELITNIIIHPLEQKSCPCGNTEAGDGFWIVTGSLDEKVHVWKLDRNVMDCSCMALQISRPASLATRHNFAKEISEFGTTRDNLGYDFSHQYRVFNSDKGISGVINDFPGKNVVKWNGVVSYRPKFYGRVTQPGGSAIVFMRDNVVGVRQTKKDKINSIKYKSQATSTRNGTHSVEGEWEVWLLDLNNPKRFDNIPDKQRNSFDTDQEVMELLVTTIPLVDESDLKIEEEQRRKETLRRREKKKSTDLRGFVPQRRRVLNENRNFSKASIVAKFPSSTVPTVGTTSISPNYKENPYNQHPEHSNEAHIHDEEETQGQVIGQVYDYRQKMLRRASMLHRVYPKNVTNSINNELTLGLDDEDQMNELLPFAFIRQVVKVGEEGVAVGYGNFVKVVLFEEIDEPTL
ncbi:hypothetical protein G9A89_010397 [Geosiphon pyriformis]|nr:hypothetical protein G9A89_010397 [Geosiphon pyriformis]